MRNDIDRILISRQRIAERIVELGAALTREFERFDDDEQIVLMPILTGSIIFVADLMRQIAHRVRIDVATVSSYPGKVTASQGSKLVGPLPENLAGRHVLIVDDILDSGGTLTMVREQAEHNSARSVRACVLLRKQRPAAMDTRCEYVGFDIPDEFVVGYGLDYDHYYRNLPDIGVLKPDAM